MLFENGTVRYRVNKIVGHTKDIQLESVHLDSVLQQPIYTFDLDIELFLDHLHNYRKFSVFDIQDIVSFDQQVLEVV
jgi:hypothetical protein